MKGLTYLAPAFAARRAWFAENTSVPLPLSKVTLGMLEDLGFGVDYSKADDFEI